MYNNRAMTNLLSLKSQTITKACNAEILVKTLVKLGVDSMFGYPGAAVLSIYNELSKTKEIKHYLVRHEQAAVHAAEGYARISGKPGVVLVTSGPGFTNTVTGIANAYADSTPLVVLVGDVATTNKDGKIFQNVDIGSIAKTCCKKCILLSEVSDIEEVIENAFEEANSGVKGPVIITLPRNVLESEYKSAQTIKTPTPVVQRDYEEEIHKFTQLISTAEKPLILVGGGCINASELIEKFASRLQCPVVSTLMGIGIYPSQNRLFLGMIGLNGTKSANIALNRCDLLIALGASFSDRSTCKKTNFIPDSKVISINLKKCYNSAQLQVEADVNLFLNTFLEQKNVFEKKQHWLMEIDTLKNDEEEQTEMPTTCLHSSYVLDTVSEFTKYYEPIVVTDVGQHQMLTAQFFNFNKPRKFITSGGLGTMGFGLPAAIGAQIANPKNLILNITGDGSFQMNLQELATCREHNIPVKIIIMNNSYLGMVRQMQEKIYNTRYQVEMINPDFTKIAEAYDLFAVRVSKKEELIPALEKAINYPGTAIIDIVIDSFENI